LAKRRRNVSGYSASLGWAVASSAA
jgi:hypothetical protein